MKSTNRDLKGKIKLLSSSPNLEESSKVGFHKKQKYLHETRTHKNQRLFLILLPRQYHTTMSPIISRPYPRNVETTLKQLKKKSMEKEMQNSPFL